MYSNECGACRGKSTRSDESIHGNWRTKKEVHIAERVVVRTIYVRSTMMDSPASPQDCQ